MEDQVYEFGKVRVVVTADSVVCSILLPTWIRRFNAQLDPAQLRGFIEDGRLVNRMQLHQLGSARVEASTGGAGYLQMRLTNRKTPRGIGGLFYRGMRALMGPFILMSEGVMRLRGSEEVQRAHEAAAAINALVAAYREGYRNHVLDLFHLYDSDVRYTWQIIPSASSGTFRTASYIFYLCVLFPAATYLLLVLLEFVSPGLAFWTSVVAAVFAVTMLFSPEMVEAGFTDSVARSQLPAYGLDGQEDPAALRLVKISTQLSVVAMFTAAGVASFALIGFMIGSPRFWFAEGFQPAPMPRLEWSLFMAEAFLDTLTLDIFGALGMDLSQVQATTRWASASVVALKVSMASGIVAAIYRAVKTGQNTHSFVGTPRELVTEVFSNTNFLSFGEVVLDGKVTALARPYVFDTTTTARMEDAWEAP
jgi:hypothetical protein